MAVLRDRKPRQLSSFFWHGRSSAYIIKRKLFWIFCRRWLLCCVRQGPYTTSPKLRCDKTRDSHKLALVFWLSISRWLKSNLRFEKALLLISDISRRLVSRKRPRFRAVSAKCRGWLFSLIFIWFQTLALANLGPNIMVCDLDGFKDRQYFSEIEYKPLQGRP